MNKTRIAVITGVSTGIGYELAKKLLNEKWTVYGSVRKASDMERLQGELGEHFKPLLFDVTDYEAIEKACAKVADECPKGIQCLVNNAGIVVGGPLLHVKMEEFEYQFNVNLFGLMKVTQAFAPLLGAREDHPIAPGRILQIGSVSGKLGMPFIGPYVASKHALEGLSESLRRELLLWGIDVIVVGPGAIKTPIWNKGADKMDSFRETPYARAMDVFNKRLIRSTLKTALEVEDLADDLVRIIEDPKPRVRYTIMAKKFRNFTLPRILPPRMVDKAIARILGFQRKQSN